MVSPPALFHVIYENDELVVVNKPNDVPMDGVGCELTVERWALAYRSRRNDGDKVDSERFNEEVMKDASQLPDFVTEKPKGKKKMVKFVHQLDYATSGVLCIAFSKEMAARLAHCFEMRTAKKAYVAVLHGSVSPLSSTIPNSTSFLSRNATQGGFRLISIKEVSSCQFILDCVRIATGQTEPNNVVSEEKIIEINLPVGYDDDDPDRFRMAVNGRDAKESLTYMYVLQNGYLPCPSKNCQVSVTKVILIPQTGRRHQLRLHCNALGFPIVGDVTYGISSFPSTVLHQNEALMEGRNTKDVEVPIRASDWSRMMLHAWRLSFPLNVEPIGDGRQRSLLKRQRRRETLGLDDAHSSWEDGVWTHFQTEDPFALIMEDKP
ncbi:hypothetical protein, conserved [Trypanosoma brucei gambiense DAL972]|uniref:Pseudouridine synthase RsuA/RluA-like domain-containing protein n=1 Tax=Trypanosoma brucei gambiense (strain MHOM/CI/86/DAL972) TaxID=679716 RepID=C9ZQW2_TRYB9|nr:hypothetical protein, conserved [Trypanosoma brucei gambiense DAL972]CBH11792.1 hypothetical protein, conserved [Trypanosoma brucei gambiense DAL972]|eukprot:XP_011774077.1 hypothetical protein, conserved [Trypanosoma brucei gambiense DAL972]